MIVRFRQNKLLSYKKLVINSLRKTSCLADTLRVLHFNITEDSANVQDITERAREGFAKSSLVLVQANWLRIEDNAMTRSNGKHKDNT